MNGGFLTLNGTIGDRGFWRFFTIVNLANAAVMFVLALAAGAGIALGWSLAA